MERGTSVENKESRSALFTVRDTEEALVRFTLLLFAILVRIFPHKILLEKQGWGDALYTTLGSKPHVLAWATGLTFAMEGCAIMFTRIQDYQDKRKKRFDEAQAKGKTEGRAEDYQEIAEWNARRLAAEVRNEPFTEPLPFPPEPPSN